MALSKSVATSHLWLFISKLIKNLKIKIKIHFLGCTIAHSPGVADGYHTGQHRYGPFRWRWKVLVISAVPECSQVGFQPEPLRFEGSTVLPLPLASCFSSLGWEVGTRAVMLNPGCTFKWPGLLYKILMIWSRPWRFWQNCDRGLGRWGGREGETRMRVFIIPHVYSQDWEQLEVWAHTQ